MRKKTSFILFPLAVLTIITLLSFTADRRKFNLSQQLNIAPAFVANTRPRFDGTRILVR